MSHSSPNFRSLFETSPGLYLVLRPDFTIAAVNDEYLKSTKTVREQILDKGIFEVFPDKPNEPNASGAINFRASLAQVLKTRLPHSMPTQRHDIRRPESEGGGYEEKYWRLVITPMLAPDGEVSYIFNNIEDVTQVVLQRDQQEIVERERDLFFACAVDLLAIVGSDGYFKRINPTFERVLGYTEAEILSKPIFEFLHPDDVSKTEKGIAALLASGTPIIDFENRYRCKDGTYKWISWNTTPIGTSFYTVGRNITQQVNAEEHIRQLYIELERKNEDLEKKIQERVSELRQSEAQVQQLQKMDAVGRLAGGIAHDFNNMLGAITLHCDLLSNGDERPETVHKSIEDMKRITVRAAALTRQLLIFSRKQILQPQTIRLNPLIQQLEKMLARLIGENIQIVMELSEDLKAVSVDPSQMEQVILNLVVNARDAMPGGGRIALETSNVYLDRSFSTQLAITEGHYVLLSVTDEGSGMDEATLGKLFEPFFTTKAVGKGTGLGLTTVYGIVKQSKGTIWVSSEPGKGSVFKVYFPVAEMLVEEPQVLPARVVDVVGTQTVLLVEDDENLRAGIGVVLRRKGYHLLVASNGAEALHLCETHSDVIHLMLTDIVMPEISGFELVKKVFALRGPLPVIYMSGYTNDALENSGMQSMAQLDFIQKPFNTNSLVSKVQEVLSR